MRAFRASVFKAFAFRARVFAAGTPAADTKRALKAFAFRSRAFASHALAVREEDDGVVDGAASGQVLVVDCTFRPGIATGIGTGLGGAWGPLVIRRYAVAPGDVIVCHVAFLPGRAKAGALARGATLAGQRVTVIAGAASGERNLTDEERALLLSLAEAI